jgi:saccharopine dehydrogenase-like NADP-dependent oxidoreductase
VIEEYTRIARIVVDGKIVEKPALSDPEIISYKEVGDLEAFNTDGLRSLLKTMKIPNMIEKTMRYPGHIDLMKIFREVGFFSDKEIEVRGKNIKPIDVTVKLMFPFWSPEKGEKDFTILDVYIDGNEGGKNSSHHYYVFDSYDSVNENSSMARTTGFTCSAVARLILDGEYSAKGICPPEYLGADDVCYNNVLSYLKSRNININHTETTK